MWYSQVKYANVNVIWYHMFWSAGKLDQSALQEYCQDKIFLPRQNPGTNKLLNMTNVIGLFFRPIRPMCCTMCVTTYEFIRLCVLFLAMSSQELITFSRKLEMHDAMSKSQSIQRINNCWNQCCTGISFKCNIRNFHLFFGEDAVCGECPSNVRSLMSQWLRLLSSVQRNLKYHYTRKTLFRYHILTSLGLARQGTCGILTVNTDIVFL